MIVFKKTILTLMLTSIAYASVSYAHDLNSSLGKKTTGKAATDVFWITCLNDGNGEPGYLYLRLKEKLPRDTKIKKYPLLSIQAYKDTISSPLSTDPINADAGYAPALKVTGVAGIYQVYINKGLSTLKAISTYYVQYHCKTATNQHTGTEIEMKQNQ